MFRTACVVLGLLSLAGCSDGCGNRMISRANAPDGLHTAVMFQRDCGATTGFSTQISVLEPRAEPSDGGNACRADTNHGAAASADWGGPWAEMKWIDDGTLLVRYASGSRIFEQSKQVSGIRINYEAVGR
jgi:hypothetical protein